MRRQRRRGTYEKNGQIHWTPASSARGPYSPLLSQGLLCQTGPGRVLLTSLIPRTRVRGGEERASRGGSHWTVALWPEPVGEAQGGQSCSRRCRWSARGQKSGPNGSSLASRQQSPGARSGPGARVPSAPTPLPSHPSLPFPPQPCLSVADPPPAALPPPSAPFSPLPSQRAERSQGHPIRA